jgi:hypothetical protein
MELPLFIKSSQILIILRVNTARHECGMKSFLKLKKNTDPEIAQRYKQTLKAIASDKSEKAVVKL